MSSERCYCDVLVIYNTVFLSLNYFCINPETEGFFQFEIIINALVVSASYEYLCYGSTIIINIFTLTVRGTSLVVRI